MAILKAMTPVVFEHGEYSDFGYVGILMPLSDLDLNQAMREYKATCSDEDEDWDNRPTEYGFLAWLVKHKNCVDLEYVSVHIGSYGRLTDNLESSGT